MIDATTRQRRFGALALAVVFFAGAGAACSRHGSGDASGVDAGASVAASASAGSAPASASAPAAPAPPLFAMKLAQEAQNRPTGTPKAEDVLAALTTAGIPLEHQAQHVATTIGAHFCIGATSPKGLRLSACEYDTDAAAAAGRDMSAKAFAKIEHRDITTNKKTTLTIAQAPYTPDSQAAHDKAVAAFKAM